MTDYNYENFSGDQYDLINFTGPEPGSRAPDATISDLAGKTRQLLDFEGQFLVLEMGSITCPLFQSRRSGMAALPGAFSQVSFGILYVREAHPGAKIGAHASPSDKTKQAQLLRDGDGEAREILIDDMQGSAHEAYGGYPNSLFIINRNGCIVYRSTWNNPRATRRALSRLLAGKPVRSEGLFLPAKPPVALHTLKQAGRGAGIDFLRSLPGMAWKNMIRRNFVILTGRR
ncbi:MAG: deiodinase-like protein, partial [Paracoccaceae bacterium]